MEKEALDILKSMQQDMKAMEKEMKTIQNGMQTMNQDINDLKVEQKKELMKS